LTLFEEVSPSTWPSFVPGLFGFRKGTKVPNCADGDSAASVAISEAFLVNLGRSGAKAPKGDPGSALEQGVRGWLAEQLSELSPGRVWNVDKGSRAVSDFYQYAHLANLQAIIDNDPSRTLKAELGSDYLIKPDVTVGLETAVGEVLHASISCKWTIRSDRVQNIRHEAVILTRHRRGRQPHIVAVTAEPLPSRLAAIARGTGEVDAVYHVALPALRAAVLDHGSVNQIDVLDELESQNRLFDLIDLLDVLVD
jgi:hypothetical protein